MFLIFPAIVVGAVTAVALPVGSQIDTQRCVGRDSRLSYYYADLALRDAWYCLESCFLSLVTRQLVTPPSVHATVTVTGAICVYYEYQVSYTVQYSTIQYSSSIIQYTPEKLPTRDKLLLYVQPRFFIFLFHIPGIHTAVVDATNPFILQLQILSSSYTDCISCMMGPYKTRNTRDRSITLSLQI